MAVPHTVENLQVVLHHEFEKAYEDATICVCQKNVKKDAMEDFLASIVASEGVRAWKGIAQAPSGAKFKKEWLHTARARAKTAKKR